MADEMPPEILTMRTTAKLRMQHEVALREERVMAEFMKKAELIQILNEEEINSVNDSYKSK